MYGAPEPEQEFSRIYIEIYPVFHLLVVSGLLIRESEMWSLNKTEMYGAPEPEQEFLWIYIGLYRVFPELALFNLVIIRQLLREQQKCGPI